jgi:hypothetical protein
MAVHTHLEELAQRIADRLARDERVVGVLLLGSVAQAHDWERSDLDLLAVVEGEGAEQAPPLLVADIEGVPAQVEWVTLDAFLAGNGLSAAPRGSEPARLRSQLEVGARAYARTLFDRTGEIARALAHAAELPDPTRDAFRLFYIAWAGHATHAAQQCLALARPELALIWARRALDEVGRLALVEGGQYPTKVWQLQLERERPDFYAAYVRLVTEVEDAATTCLRILDRVSGEIEDSLPACRKFVRAAFEGCPGPLSLRQLISRLQTACQIEFARALGPAAWGLVEQLVERGVLRQDKRRAEYPTRGNGVVFDEIVYAPAGDG